jgi:hypothetical protein
MGLKFATNALKATTFLVATGFCSAAMAQTTANLIFAVDESGSMGGEQTFLGTFASEIETSLTGSGFSTVNFGLTGFGNDIGGDFGADNLGRLIEVGGGFFGNAAAFSTATGDLLTSGGFEDGFSAIDFILRTYPITVGASTTIILVTDEDRDDGNPSLSFGSISGDLNDLGVNLITVVDADFEDDSGNPAIATDGTNAFVQDGTSFTTAPFGLVTNADGTTEEDYIDLAFSTPNGCSASLNQLREGGDAASAFAAALLQCLTVAAQAGGQLIPLNQYRDSTRLVMDHHRSQVRRLAYGPAALAGMEGDTVTRDAQVANDMFGMNGLRGYASVSAFTGDTDADGSNVALDFDGYGILVGADHALPVASGMARFGASLGYSEIEADQKAALSSLDTDSTTLQLYSVYAQSDGFYTQGNIQYAWHDFTNNRVAGATTFVGTPDGESFGAEVEIGFRQAPRPLGKDAVNPAALHLTPFAALGYEYHSVDAYTESNGGVAVASFDEDTAYGRLGIRAMIEQFHKGSRYYSALELAGTGSFSGTGQGVPINGGATLAPISDADDLRLDVRLEAGAELTANSAVFINVHGAFSDHARHYAATAGFEVKF